MKIINGKQLGYMPNGTVFSDIESRFDPNDTNGDMDINGLNILAGHDNSEYFSQKSGRFHGVLHMLGYVSCCGTEVDEKNPDDWDDLTDTDSNDYTEDDWVIVYEKWEIEKIIKNLQWALKGCVN